MLESRSEGTYGNFNRNATALCFDSQITLVDASALCCLSSCLRDIVGVDNVHELDHIWLTC